MPELIVTKDIDAPGLDTLDGYSQHGGYEALSKALKEYQPDELVEHGQEIGAARAWWSRFSHRHEVELSGQE